MPIKHRERTREYHRRYSPDEVRQWKPDWTELSVWLQRIFVVVFKAPECTGALHSNGTHFVTAQKYISSSWRSSRIWLEGERKFFSRILFRCKRLLFIDAGDCALIIYLLGHVVVGKKWLEKSWFFLKEKKKDETVSFHDKDGGHTDDLQLDSTINERIVEN